MLLIREDDVRRLLPMKDAVQQVKSSFIEFSSGAALNQSRRRLFLPTGSVLHQMAGSWKDYYGTKFYAVNVKRGMLTFHVMLYSAETAEPLALIEANALGQIRTGAASGVATDALAPQQIETVGLIGSGFQSWTQLEAVLTVRPNTKDVRVYSRKAERRESFAARASEAFGVAVRAVESAEQTVRDAQVVITCTYAKDPVIEDSWIADGAHVNAAGSNQKDRREIPTELVKRASLIAVDSLEQARLEAGDLLLAVPPDEWTSLPVRELGAILADSAFVRPAGVTLFESLGLAVQDIAAAAAVYERAQSEGVGERI